MLALQSQICSWVPSFVVADGSSRHRPEPWFTIWPSGSVNQAWLGVLLHVHSCSLDPLAVPLLTTSRHLPWIVMLFSSVAIHCWDFSPLQVQSWTLVPLAALALVSSAHMCEIFEVIAPVGRVQFCCTCLLQF